MAWLIWGNASDDYNTVVATISPTYFPFFYLQLFRMVSMLSLTITSGLFFYIFFKVSFMYYNFYNLIVTTGAFWCLFIGAGRQSCYQQKIADYD